MRLAQALAEGPDARSALTLLCDEIRRLLPCDRVQIWRGDVRQMSMHTVVASGFPPAQHERVTRTALPMGDLNLLREGFLTTKLTLVEDVATLSPYDQEMFLPYGLRSALWLLIERGARPLGALQLSWCERGRAHVPEQPCLDLIRNHVALGIDLLARTDEALTLSQGLSETATLLARIHDPDELLEAMARKVAEAVGCDWASVHLFDEHSREMRRVAFHGISPPPTETRAPSGALEWMKRQFATSEDTVLEIADVSALDDDLLRERSREVSSYFCLPLTDEGALVGILTVGYRERTGRFARRQISIAKGLAQHALVALRNARLVRSLEEANRVKSDFVAAVSHDLRTPLHVLIGYNSMLLEGAAGALNDEQRALVARMYDCSVHFLDLINGVLGLGRVEAGFDRVVRTHVSLPQLCDDIRREVEYLRRPEVELRFDAEPCEVSSDVGKLTTIVRNLVTNALKFTTEGFVEVRLRTSDDELRITVRDTGPGIAPEERPKVFEMFRQGAAGLRAGGSGLGLGLYLVQRLTQMLDGAVELTSGAAGETVFEVRLPLPHSIV